MENKKEPIIDLEGITVSYGRLKALSGVSVRTEAGAVGLLGPNGAGKSTLLKTVLGFLKPESGVGRVLGFDIVRNPLDIRLRVGYMSEDESYVAGLNAINLVSFAGELCGMSRSDAMQRAHEVMNYVGIDELRYRKVESFSTGMKQRTKLAQALVHDPRILFLDEPTNGLDPKGRREMLDLIKDIAENKGVSLILSSHLLPDVEYACSRVIMINKGNIVAQGSIETLKGAHRRLYDLRFKGEWQRFAAALGPLGSECRYFRDDIYRAPLPEGEDPAFFFRVARDTNVQIRHLMPSKPTLEDVFITLIGEDAHADL
jgi:ABC-2 type transport system ATP-binding protein